MNGEFLLEFSQVLPAFRKLFFKVMIIGSCGRDSRKVHYFFSFRLDLSLSSAELTLQRLFSEWYALAGSAANHSPRTATTSQSETAAPSRKGMAKIIGLSGCAHKLPPCNFTFLSG